MSLFDDIVSDLGAFGAGAVETARAILQLSEQINNLAKNDTSAYLAGLDKQIAANEKLAQSFIDAAEDTLVLERRNAQINKTFGVNVKTAAKLSEAFQSVAQSINKTNEQYQITGVQAAKYGGSIKKMVPMLNQVAVSNKEFYVGMQQTQHILTTNIGLSEDAANAYTQYAMQNGNNAASMLSATKALSDSLDPEGTMGYFKMITTEIAATSEEITLQYGKIPGNLEMAVLKAKKFGFALDDLANTATDLLEIENSVGQELEYQLLSGRRLVDAQGNSLTNMYREAALRGDMNKQADIMNTILENEGETLEDNMFARKQMADMLGMDEKKLASALQKKKILEKAASKGIDIDLNAADSGKALAAAANAVKEGAISDEDYQALVDASDTRTTDDIMKQQLNVMQESLIIDMLQLQQATAVQDNQKNLLDETKKSKGIFADLESSLIKIGEIRTAAKSAGVYDPDYLTKLTTAGGAYPKNSVDENDDAVITPGYGKRVLSFPEDTLQAPIAFNDNDTIVAGTNLAGKGGGNMPDLTQFAAMIVAAINNQTRALKSDATFSGGLNAPYYG